MLKKILKSNDLCQLPVCPAEHYQPPCLGLGLLRVDNSSADHVVGIGVVPELARHDAGGVLEGHESVAVDCLESMLVNNEERENLQ